MTAPDTTRQADAVKPDLQTVIKFLLGEGELDGVWFGDINQKRNAAFWWRPFLRAAVSVQDMGELPRAIHFDRAHDAVGPVDANVCEQFAKQHPDDYFLKGSGVLKLLGAIRQLEAELKAGSASRAEPVAPSENLRLTWITDLEKASKKLSEFWRANSGCGNGLDEIRQFLIDAAPAQPSPQIGNAAMPAQQADSVDEREAFEKCFAKADLRRNVVDGYCSQRADDAWEGWWERASLQADTILEIQLRNEIAELRACLDMVVDENSMEQCTCQRCGNTWVSGTRITREEPLP